MAQAAKAPHNLLMPSPKELDKALTLSADRAHRMAAWPHGRMAAWPKRSG